MDFPQSLTPILKESFEQYAGAVIQSRALVDVRDCVKPSTRQIYYALYTDGFLSSKPFKKTLKAIGSTMRFYIHGDASCEGILMRSGQPFFMRYPLIEVEGSFGNLMASGNWAAPRYTASRLSELAEYLLDDTDVYSIEEWADNYDDTEQYPRVLASKGFYNIVNGTTGIAVGIATSIPQFNLIEVNKALCTLLDNEEANFDDIYCAPDFTTGGSIINASAVKESLKSGKGDACIIRADIEVNKDKNLLIVRSVPYSVYTNTICTEIEKIANSDKNPGIVDMLDLTGENVCIKIKLDKKADCEKVKEFLYQNTSLQSSYGINMMMLEDGRYPKLFGWKEALLAHLKHEKQIYINSYTHKLEILRHKFKIVCALISAVENIDDVVNIIKNAESTSDANKALQKFLSIEEFQAKAILDIKLARLAKLEEEKLLQDRADISAKGKAVKAILQDENLLKAEMKKRFQEVSQKFGDSRRTALADIKLEKFAAKTKKEKEPERCVVCLADNGFYLKRVPVAQYRESSANSLAISTSTDKTVNIFTALGKVYRVKVEAIKECLAADKGAVIGSLVTIDNNDIIRHITGEDEEIDMFAVTLGGRVKRFTSQMFNGRTQNKRGSSYIKLGEKDEVKLLVVLDKGRFIKFTCPNDEELVIDGSTVTPSGKTSSGQVGFKFAAKATDKYIIKAEQFSQAPSTIGKVGSRGKKVVA